MFFGKKFDKNKNNPRKTWKRIKSLSPNNKETLPTINNIVVGDKKKYVKLLQLLIILIATLLVFKVLRSSGFIKEISTNFLRIRKLTG